MKNFWRFYETGVLTKYTLVLSVTEEKSLLYTYSGSKNGENTDLCIYKFPLQTCSIVCFGLLKYCLLLFGFQENYLLINVQWDSTGLCALREKF